MSCEPIELEQVWLAGDQSSFHLNYSTWLGLVQAAEAGGWQPLGSEAPERLEEDASGELIPAPPTPWFGDYRTVQGQYITAPDAAALGKGVEYWLSVHGEAEGEEGPPIELSLLQDFIRFTREGGFSLC